MVKYCLIKKNRIYENLYDMLEAEELSMQRKQDEKKIKQKIREYIKNFEKKNVIYNKVEENENIVEDIINKFIEEEEEYETQGNTILCQIYNNYMYEIIYAENLDNKIKKKDENLNEYLSLCNINMEPIYKSGVIIKTVYKDNKIYNEDITIEDLERILINNFYYKGVIIENEEKIIEIEFTGEDVIKEIGNTFELEGTSEIFELTLVIYREKSENKKKEINKMASKILKREIEGRIFICLLCPITKKKYMHMTEEIIKKIYNILLDDEKTKNLNYELQQADKLLNPLIFVEKYK
jgi:hypothetical protein